MYSYHEKVEVCDVSALSYHTLAISSKRLNDNCESTQRYLTSGTQVGERGGCRGVRQGILTEQRGPIAGVKQAKRTAIWIQSPIVMHVLANPFGRCCK